jgi:hypothetical protein
MTVRQIQSREFSENWRMILPLLEEMAGVRTDVETNSIPVGILIGQLAAHLTPPLA